ncbi:MAG: MoaD/ThiS family protein [Rhodocyclales bacterium]|nr:MoaD/ThiS family protein [Rhodocyclales bacterium]
MIRVVLPTPLRTLARIDGEVTVEPAGPPTLAALIDALEAAYPALAGTLRDPTTRRRRPLLRFFACGEDLSHAPLEMPLPAAVADGREPLLVVGAIAGG